MDFKSSVFLLLLSAVTIESFQMKSVKPQTATVDEDGTLELMCTGDDYFEWCTFKHDGKICDFEWKRETWNVHVLECKDFEDRMERIGNYDNYECGIRIKGVKPEDAGKWNCELENYYRGYYRGYGYQINGTMEVEVVLKTTTTTTTTTSTTTTTTTTSTTTESSSMTSDYTSGNEYDDEEYTEDISGAESNIHEQISGEKPTEEESTSFIYILVGIIVAVVVAALIVMLGLHYKRKLPPGFYAAFGQKRWKPVLGNEEYPVTEQDEKINHPTIIKNGTNGTSNGKSSDVGPMSEEALVNPSLTTVSWSKSETNGKETEVKENNQSAQEEDEEKKPLQE